MKHGTRATLTVALLLAGCLWAGRVEAQGLSGGGSGHFTLPYSVEWAGRTLEPGRYTVTVMPRRSATLFIRVSGQGRDLLLMPAELSSRGSVDSQLALVSTRGRRIVRAIQLGGMTATFRTPRGATPSGGEPALASAVGSLEFVHLSDAR